MGKDRIVIITCLVLMVGLLVGAASLMEPIDQQRAELQLTAHDDVMENLPPEIALTQAALGSFRGLAVNVLWGRVQRMQQEGQLYEAMQLADWLTKLQPRFAAVWVFHAWNMSYNISVTTHTPQERWMWVNAGIRLLRDEAIPLNPRSVELYRQLGWIFLHKVGMYNDDMHWHYKAELAAEWHALLGEPPPASETEQVLAWFEPIATMYEAYVNERHLGYAVREELERLAMEEREIADLVDDLHALTIQQLQTRIQSVTRNDEELAETLAPLRQLVHEQVRTARRDPVERLREGDEEVAEQLDRLREQGLRANRAFLGRIAEINAEIGSVDLQLMDAVQDEEELEGVDAWLRQWLQDEEIAEQRERLLAFARARVLHEDYRMDPIWMYELMRGRWFETEDGEPIEIPVDWRHPAAHGMYWSSLGVRRHGGLLRPEDFNVLNTDRQVIQSIQSLTRTGNLVFDPATRYYRVLPNPAYIDAYHASMFGAGDRLSDQLAEDTTAPESFKGAHENFLTDAVRMAYFYGDMSDARRYYRQLRDRYSDFQPDRAERYSQPLEDFIFQQFADIAITDSMDQMLAIVSGLVMQAIEEGLANGRREVANRYLDQAQRAHGFYNTQRAEMFDGVADVRLSLPDYNEILTDTFQRFLLEPNQSPLLKARAWQNAPSPLKQRVFDRVREPLHAQAAQAGLSGSSMFPEPQGMSEFRVQRGDDAADAEVLESSPDRQ